MLLYLLFLNENNTINTLKAATANQYGDSNKGRHPPRLVLRRLMTSQYFLVYDTGSPYRSPLICKYCISGETGNKNLWLKLENRTCSQRINEGRETDLFLPWPLLQSPLLFFLPSVRPSLRQLSTFFLTAAGHINNWKKQGWLYGFSYRLLQGMSCTEEKTFHFFQEF